jgi:hypothetical protein
MVTSSPTTSTHDGDWNAGGAYNTAIDFISVGQASSLSYHGWILFPALTVPQGITITSAYLTVKAYSTPTTGTLSDIRTKIFANDVDDAAVPTSAANADAKSLTTASVDWDPATFAANTIYQSPDITAVIQEVIDRPGWASGNDLMILWKNDGTLSDSRLLTYSVDSGGVVALLTVNYEEILTDQALSDADTLFVDTFNRLTYLADQALVAGNILTVDAFGRLITPPELEISPYWVWRFIRQGGHLLLTPTRNSQAWAGGDVVSERFRINSDFFSTANTAVLDAWTAHKGDSTAVLKAAIDLALWEAGFDAADGSPII